MTLSLGGSKHIHECPHTYIYMHTHAWVPLQRLRFVRQLPSRWWRPPVCMYACMYVCMYLCAYMQVCVQCVYACIYSCMCQYLYAYVFSICVICVGACVHACICEWPVWCMWNTRARKPPNAILPHLPPPLCAQLLPFTRIHAHARTHTYICIAIQTRARAPPNPVLPRLLQQTPPPRHPPRLPWLLPDSHPTPQTRAGPGAETRHLGSETAADTPWWHSWGVCVSMLDLREKLGLWSM